jgi:putative phage-type endonuclease
MLSAEQLAQRRAGISATDVSSIVGLNPWSSPIDVFLDKTGRKPPFEGNSRTKWGNLLEPQIRDDYAERRGLRVEVPGTLDHPEVTWAKATPDGICYWPGGAVPINGLEIKSHSSRVAHMYGEPGTDAVPAHILIQCQWNLFVSGLDIWDLVAFIDNQPLDYVIRRDDELIGLLRDRCERFLVDHIRADVPPEPDGSASYDKYLLSRFPQRDEELRKLEASDKVIDAVHALRIARGHADHYEQTVDTLTQQLKLACGEFAGLEYLDEHGKRERITYRASKDSTKTDWEGAFREYAARVSNDAYAQEAISNHSRTVPGSRRFVVPRAWGKNSSKGE